MSTVFDTIVGRGSVAPAAGATIATAFVLQGAIYSLTADILVLASTASSTGNVTLFDGASAVTIAYNLLASPGLPIYGSISIPRLVSLNGVFTLKVNGADASGAYFGQIQASPLRGSFQS